MHNVEVIEIKTFSFKRISLYIQLILLIGLVVCGIVSFFVNMDIMLPIIYGVLALLMLIMAYNNKIFYKRKYMTYIYLLLSVILIGSMIVEIV